MLRRRLLGELERAGAADDSKTLALGARSCRFLELGFDVVAVTLSLVCEDTASIFPRCDDAVGGEFGCAVGGDGAIDGQVAGLARRATLPVIDAVLDDAGKLPGITFGISLGRASELGEPVAVEAIAAK